MFQPIRRFACRGRTHERAWEAARCRGKFEKGMLLFWKAAESGIRTWHQPTPGLRCRPGIGLKANGRRVPECLADKRPSESRLFPCDPIPNENSRDRMQRPGPMIALKEFRLAHSRHPLARSVCQQIRCQRKSCRRNSDLFRIGTAAPCRARAGLAAMGSGNPCARFRPAAIGRTQTRARPGSDAQRNSALTFRKPAAYEARSNQDRQVQCPEADRRRRARRCATTRCSSGSSTRAGWPGTFCRPSPRTGSSPRSISAPCARPAGNSPTTGSGAAAPTGSGG